MKGSPFQKSVHYFSDLSKEDIRHQARTLGLSIDDADLDEVRFRLNALDKALEHLEHQELAVADPLPLMTSIGE